MGSKPSKGVRAASGDAKKKGDVQTTKAPPDAPKPSPDPPKTPTIDIEKQTEPTANSHDAHAQQNRVGHAPDTATTSTPGGQPSRDTSLMPWLEVLNKVAELDPWNGIRRQDRPEWREHLEKADEIAKRPRQEVPNDKVQELYSGAQDVSNLPPLNNKVKVFVSSTFTDTKAERNLLMRDVYPYLREVCRRLGLDFGTSDMRWGVTDEATTTHSTTKICTDEIHRCIEESCGPAFLCILSHKYGFRPLPANMPEAEYDAFLAYFINNQKNTNLLKKYYKQDKNALDSEYVLQSIDKNDNTVWQEMEELHDQLREAVTECFKGRADICDKYFISVTETEIRTGAFENKKSDEQALFLIRELKDIETEFHRHRRVIDMNGDVLVESAKEMLTKLVKETVPKYIKNDKRHYVTYSKTSVQDVSASVVEFCDHICSKLVDMIFDNYQKNNSFHVDKTLAEVLQHLSIGKEKRKMFIGRQSEMDAIMKYLSSGNKNKKPLVVYGASGCGKTSIMGMASAKAKGVMKKGVIVTRFIGTTSLSGSVRDLLMSICKQIGTCFYQDTSNIPESLSDLVKCFHSFLALATKTSPFVLLLDSLDQLSTDDNGRKLDWLNLDQDLPSYVKVIVSTLPEGPYDIVKKHVPAKNLVAVKKLLPGEGPTILKEMLKLHGRTVTSSQEKLIMTSFLECPLPLFLRLAADVALRWKSYDIVDEQSIASNVKTMINLLFERLESKYGKEFVTTALSYITASKHGLAQSELEDILSFNDNVLDLLFKYWTPPMRRLPPLLWARVRNDLGVYLAERGVQGVVAYTWYHRQFLETARERFLLSTCENEGKLREAIHTDIAEYFEGKWAKGKPQSGNQPSSKTGKAKSEDRGIQAQPLVLRGNRDKGRQLNKRKLSELPFHLIQLWDWKRFTELVLDPEFLEAKFEAGLGHECYREITEAARNSGDEILTKIVRFLGPNLSFLIREPSVLYQLISQQPASHPLHKELTKLFKEGRAPALTLLCDTAAGNDAAEQHDPCLLTLQGHTGAVRSCAFSPKEDILISSGEDCSVRLWDTLTGSLVSMSTTLPKPTTRGGFGSEYPTNQCCFSPDGETIATGTEQGDVILWDNEGPKTHTINTEYRTITCVQFSPDNKYLAFGTVEGMVAVWSVPGFELEFTVQLDMSVVGIDYSPDGNFLAAAFNEGIAKIDIDRKSLAWRRRDRPCNANQRNTRRKVMHALLCCCYHPATQQIMTGACDSHIGIWDAGTGECLQKLGGHMAWIWSIKMTRDGQYMFSAASDRTIKVWHYFKHWSCESTIHGHSHRVVMLALDPRDDSRLASTSLDCSIKIWDVSALKKYRSPKEAPLDPRQMIEEDFLPYNTLAISPDTDRIAVSLGWAKYCEVRSFTKPKTPPDDADTMRFMEKSNTPPYLLFETSIRHRKGFVRSGEFTLDGKQIVVLDHGHLGDYLDNAPLKAVCIVYDSTTGELIKELTITALDRETGNPTDGPTAVACGRNYIYVGTMKGDIYVFDTQAFEPRSKFRPADFDSVQISTLASSPVRDQLVLTGGAEGAVCSFQDGKMANCFELPIEDSPISASAISRNGSLLITGTDSGKITVWTIAEDTFTKIHKNNKHTSAVKCLRFSPAGKKFLTCGDFSLRVWSADGPEVVQIGVYFGPINAAVFKDETTVLAGDTKGKLTTLSLK